MVWKYNTRDLNFADGGQATVDSHWVHVYRRGEGFVSLTHAEFEQIVRWAGNFSGYAIQPGAYRVLPPEPKAQPNG